MMDDKLYIAIFPRILTEMLTLSSLHFSGIGNCQQQQGNVRENCERYQSKTHRSERRDDENRHRRHKQDSE